MVFKATALATFLAHLSPQRLPTDPGSMVIEGPPSASFVRMWKLGGPSVACTTYDDEEAVG